MPDLSEFTRKWRPARHFGPIIAVACLGLVVAAAAWFGVSVWEERLAKAKFNARSVPCARSTTPHTRSIRMNSSFSPPEYWGVVRP